MFGTFASFMPAFGQNVFTVKKVSLKL